MAESHQAVHERKKVSADCLDQLFLKARTHWVWRPEAVPLELLKEVYNLARFGPTSANSSPARFVFLTTPQAKERLRPALSPTNVEKTMTAPVTVIVAWDTEFHEKLPQLFPARDMRALFAGNPALIHETAFRNGTLQGAYFMLAARALGLDCGPMSGFNNAKVDEAFFSGTTVKSNFLCNLGHGGATKPNPRSPRLAFDEACKVI